MLFITDDELGIVDMMFDNLPDRPETDAFMEAVSVFALDSDRQSVWCPEDMSEKQKRVALAVRKLGIHVRSLAMKENGKSGEEFIRECHELWLKMDKNSYAEMRKLYKEEILFRLEGKLGKLVALIESGELHSDSVLDVLHEIFNDVVMELIEMLKDIRGNHSF